jgi:DNA primase
MFLMNFEKLDHLQIIDYLNSKGIQPTNIKYGSAWYLSPFRQETTPSFKVNLNKNLWFDFGSGEGGNLFKLVMKLCNCSSSEVFEKLSCDIPRVMMKEVTSSDESGRIIINHIEPLRRYGLKDYLTSRRVNLDIAKMFVSEASYSVHGKEYFALAFKNDLGGYELRNAYFKTGSSPKYYTTIEGIDSTRVNIFEGFMDFLSCCTLYGHGPRFRTIVLNSLSFLPRIEQSIASSKSINLYLDNDRAGWMAAEKFKADHNQVKDLATILYPHHKDLNDFLKMSRN